MMLKKLLVCLVFAVAGLGVQVQDASAQANRTWVSGVGDDVNPCSRTAPCKTFAGAISKTAAGGEINTLDPAGFGFVTITKAISIIHQGGVGGIANTATNGIVVNAPAGAEVVIEGLDIDGYNTGGLTGVRVLSASTVTIRKTRIRNQAIGVEVAGPQGTRVTIEDSQISGSTTGLKILGAAGAANSVAVINSTIERNGVGVEVNTKDVVMLRGSNIFGNTDKDLSLIGAAKANSLGDNLIVTGDLPTKLIPLK